MIWYIEKLGEAKRVPEEVLKYKIENDEISGDTLTVNEVIKNWIPLKESSLWSECHSEKPCKDTASAGANTTSYHRWRCSKCGNMIDNEPCPYCAQNATEQTSAPPTNSSSIDTRNAHKQSPAKALITFIIVFTVLFVGIFLCIDLFAGNGSNSKTVYCCPHCGSTDVWAASHNTETGIQNFKCNYCHCAWTDWDNGLRQIYKGDCIGAGKVN